MKKLLVMLGTLLKLTGADVWGFSFDFTVLQDKGEFLCYPQRLSRGWISFDSLYQNCIRYKWKTNQSKLAQSHFSGAEFKKALDLQTFCNSIVLKPLEEQPIWYNLYQYKLVVLYSLNEKNLVSEVRDRLLIPMTDYLLNHSSILSMILYMNRVDDQICSFELWLFCSAQLKYSELQVIWLNFNQLSYQTSCVSIPNKGLSSSWLERFYSEIFFNPNILLNSNYFAAFTCKTNVNLVRIMRNLGWVKAADRTRDCGQYVQDFQDIFNEGVRRRLFTYFFEKTAVTLYLPWIFGFGYNHMTEGFYIPYVGGELFFCSIYDDWAAICVEPSWRGYHHPALSIEVDGTDAQRLQLKNLKEEYLFI